ncbi:unnamed protein product [Didymodactylos carnosus]|uniref:Uncharacterized protein n=1 Tax=Didymodactylos carnosus TaxID=1234261 RepID=A0A815WQM2_9BILA|nr:unnamed protein product [Didymodactylos carnosus]CAF4411815.1 unnamed protein product [Didymodactylos carnosus]
MSVLETALYIAETVLKKHDLPKSRKAEKLTFRTSVNSALLGNKHIVAMWGVFQVTQESNEIIRSVIPTELREQIRQLKFVRYKGKDIPITKPFGADMMNIVHVMGLEGFSSHHPCV